MNISRRQILILLPAAAVAWKSVLAGTPEASPNYRICLLYTSLAWLRDRRQSILIWMTGFCLAPVGILLLDNAMLIRLPFNVALGLEQPVYSLEDISLWFLLLSLLQLSESHSLVRKVRIAARINATAFILDGLLILGMYNWTRDVYKRQAYSPRRGKFRLIWAARTVLAMSMAMVSGPTPPGTGV